MDHITFLVAVVIVDDTLVTPGMIFAGLVGAILWNLTTWLFGLPSSSSHALFGGLIGAGWVGGRRHSVHFDKVVEGGGGTDAMGSAWPACVSWRARPWWRTASV